MISIVEMAKSASVLLAMTYLPAFHVIIMQLASLSLAIGTSVNVLCLVMALCRSVWSVANKYDA